MTFPFLTRIRAAVAALRGRLPEQPTLPPRIPQVDLVDITTAMSRIATLQAGLAAQKKSLDALSVSLTAAAQRKVD